jgi:hypothetical protein
MSACTFTSKNEELLRVVKAQSIVEHISSAVIFRGTVCNASTSGFVYVTDKFARHVLCVAFLLFALFFKIVQRGFAVQGQYLTLRHDHFHPHPFHLTIHHRPTIRCYIN